MSKKKKIVVINEEKALLNSEEFCRNVNHSELVELLRLGQVNADRSMSPEMLKEKLMYDIDLPESKLWAKRKELKQFLENNPRIRLDPKACPRDCDRCPDLVVVICYSQSAVWLAYKKGETNENTNN